MQKTNAGFSYVEVIAACALFVIILMAVLPLTLGARQNLALAQENRRLSLAATSLSLAVRDLSFGALALTDENIRNLALGFGVENYSIHIFNSDGIGSHFHSSENIENMSLAGFVSLNRGTNSRFIYVVVRNRYNTKVGSAISVAIDYNHTSGIWRSTRG